MYRLDLPATNRVHLVFSANCLYKALDNLLLGQTNDPALPVQYNGKDKWEVKEVLAV